ncbi:lipocalin family protein [Tenacibaculum agarivorans]|uniref:lipocalin family protein n=1 Tax=Tenacibaculum agarivorans TaxID=1908389 RepID=UPI00094B7DBF|nr:lipocalin family protein [Tenacibaculum agarivorans]
MKKLILLFLSISLLIACSDDQDGVTDISNDDIVGTWNITKSEFSGTATATVQGIPVTGSAKGTGKDYDLALTFKENPNEFSFEGTFTSVVEVSIQGQTQIVERELNSLGEVTVGTWKIENNQLFFENGGVTSEALPIESISSNKIVVKIDIDQTFTSPQDIPVTVKGIGTVILEK